MPTSRQRWRLVDALRLSADRPQEQMAAFPGSAQIPDRIARYFDEAIGFLPHLLEQGVITEEQAQAIRRLDRQFAEMTAASDREYAWTVEALRTDARWVQVRELAAEALAALHEPLEVSRLETGGPGPDIKS